MAKSARTEGPLPKFDFPIVMRNVSEIKVNPNNPRVIRDKEFQKLVRSVKADPFIMYLRPPVVDENDMILGGNQRFEAWKTAGYKTIPTIPAKALTPEQKQAFIIKDNVQSGEWDWDVLGNLFELPQLQEWGMEVPDFGIQDTEPGVGEGSAPKKEVIQYNIVFASKEQYDEYLSYIKTLKAAAVDPDALISTLIIEDLRAWKRVQSS